jgi:hypothetical protein
MRGLSRFCSDKGVKEDTGQPVDQEFTTVTSSTVSILETPTIDADEDPSNAVYTAWEKVQKRLQVLAMENSWEIKPQLDIPDVLRLLDEVDRRDQAAHNRHSKIKDRFSKTLQCVSAVGGLAASGASEVRHNDQHPPRR